MPKYKNYFVVEFRVPVQVDDVDTVQEATSRAKRICERQYGFNPDNWYARIFEYSSEQDKPGPTAEYFYNPNSSSFREVMKNIGYHKDMIEKGIDPSSPEEISNLSKEEIDDSEI